MTRGRYGVFPVAAALLCLASSLLIGCAAERAVFVTDSGLTGESLRDGGLAIVGVTVVEEVEQVRPPLIAALEGVLKESRPDLSFRSAGAVRDSLGPPAYRRILSAYQSTGRLSAPDREELAVKLHGGVRFALLARVEKNVVRLPPTRRTVYGGSAPPDFASRAVSRDARVRVTLYDLAAGREAFGAVYASSSDNAHPDSVPRLPDRPILPRAGEAAETPLPETPSLAEALLEGFRAFAEDLPSVAGVH